MKSMSHKDACKNLRSFKLRWMNTWHKQRSKKEAAFIWAVWNKAVAVNLGEPKQTALRLKAASYGVGRGGVNYAQILGLYSCPQSMGIYQQNYQFGGLWICMSRYTVRT